jgi:arylsulfatase A-like enzyme
MEKAVHLDPHAVPSLRWLVQHHHARRDAPLSAYWLDRLMESPRQTPAEREETLRLRREVEKLLPPGAAQHRPEPIAPGDLLPERWLRKARGKSSRARAGGPPRRVLLATLDTTRADRLGCYGHAAARTPFLDRMAAEGVRFERAWCAAPITLPSHATLLTGVWPAAHGVRDNGLFVLDGGATLLSEALSSEGFATGAFVGSFVLDARFGLAQGFDVYRGPAPSKLGLEPEMVERPAGAVVDDALEWARGLPRDASFLVWVHFYDPHAPHETGAAPGDPYDAEIALCDAELARLRGGLERMGFAEGLLEIVTADHGEGLGEHGEETHGLLLHDATMRVPILLRGAGMTAGRVVREPASHAQIAPTVLFWLGLDARALPEARAAPLPTEGEGGARSEPAPLLLETFLPFHLHRWRPLVGIVAGEWKLVRGRFDELFELTNDPGESKNLAAERAELAQSLARRLEAELERLPRLPAPAGPQLSAQERALLLSLGYAGSDGGGDGAEESLPDPREAIGGAKAQQEALALLRQARGLLGQDQALAQAGAIRAKGEERAKGLELLERARSLLLPLAQEHPRDPSIAFDLGNVELSAGRAAEAVPCFELAALADPASSIHHYNLAIAYAGAGRQELAIAEMEKAVHCEPRLQLAWRWLVSTHDQRGELGRAVWWADRVEDSGALEPRDLGPMRLMRDKLRARMRAAGQEPDPPPGFPPRDLRPEGVLRRESSPSGEGR